MSTEKKKNRFVESFEEEVNIVYSKPLSEVSVEEAAAYKIKKFRFDINFYDGLTAMLIELGNRAESIIPPRENKEDFKKDKEKTLKYLLDIEGEDYTSGKTADKDDKEDKVSFFDKGLIKKKAYLVKKFEEFYLPDYPIWDLWFKRVPGIGPSTAAKLLLYWSYMYIPICRECGGDLIRESEMLPTSLEEFEKEDEVQKEDESGRKKKDKLICSDCCKIAKNDGVLRHRIEKRDFPTVSKWWHYMGMHLVEDPKNPGHLIKPKRQKGVRMDWNPNGRKLCYLIAQQFRKQKNSEYAWFMKEAHTQHARNHPEWTKAHVYNSVNNAVGRLFLSHFWEVMRKIEGKPTPEIYVQKYLGHTNISKPFYWSDEILKAAKG